MIKIERDKDRDWHCDGCGENGTYFSLAIESGVRGFSPFGGYEIYLCEKCLTELKEKIGRFIY
ncbi:hypothetical protein PDQ75_25130 [Bacillus cereus group sp. Bc015]|uniref:hypothetical protein n=1 Tax=Bacillus cereus group sp. Bc015 TaxID=3018123 RepID=UPI0022E4065F|nr:hypothetical protein [Bacillus cereus group sp. Bc015]MDA2738441.1 hypothetical protein [Bacillus cereus group sp. Bc015]